MILEFVEKFMAGKAQIEAQFRDKHPDEYKDIVSAVVGLIGGDGEYGKPDKNRIHVINDGDSQGTLLFVIASGGYQPDEYWYVKVFYGSCSGCDTLESIRCYNDGPPSEEQIKDYMTLALHIVQGIKKMDDHGTQ